LRSESLGLREQIDVLNHYISVVAEKISEANTAVTASTHFSIDNRRYAVSWMRIGSEKKEWSLCIHDWPELNPNPSDNLQRLESSPLHIRTAAARVLPQLVEALVKKTREVAKSLAEAVPEV